MPKGSIDQWFVGWKSENKKVEFTTGLLRLSKKNFEAAQKMLRLSKKIFEII